MRFNIANPGGVSVVGRHGEIRRPVAHSHLYINLLIRNI